MELGEYIYSDIEKNTYLISLYTNLIKKYAIKVFNILDMESEISINISFIKICRYIIKIY